MSTAHIIPSSRIARFRAAIYRLYNERGRDLPWRRTNDPYRIVVSEIMLQQTQVDRVCVKYPLFIKRFPSLKVLAGSSDADILGAWQGLGYNRRALSLKRMAGMVLERFAGKIPDDPLLLQELPGIGPATARSICAFAFNRPVVFIETNIRSVFIHEFFKDKEGVTDDEIMPLVERTLDRDAPCRWYNALMDYGVELKKKHANPSRKSASYIRQAAFEGSDRQIRGAIIRSLVAHEAMTRKKLFSVLDYAPARMAGILEDLKREGLVKYNGGLLTL